MGSTPSAPDPRLPRRLAALHARTPVGTGIEATLAGPPECLDRLLEGAGFTGVDLAAAPRGRTHVRAVRARTLADVVGPGMRVLVCGLNPSLYAADAGIPFARPGNRFWPAARAAGLVRADRDPWRAYDDGGVGFTDLVKRATTGADELSAAEYRAGAARVGALVEWLQPGVVCFVGLAGWRAAIDRRAGAGVQRAGFAGRPAYVMPSTSGLNARTPLDELAGHLRAAGEVAG